jgi:hypothetical protein
LFNENKTAVGPGLVRDGDVAAISAVTAVASISPISAPAAVAAVSAVTASAWSSSPACAAAASGTAVAAVSASAADCVNCNFAIDFAGVNDQRIGRLALRTGNAVDAGASRLARAAVRRRRSLKKQEAGCGAAGTARTAVSRHGSGRHIGSVFSNDHYRKGHLNIPSLEVIGQW